MRITLPLGNSQKKKKKKVQTLPSGRTFYLALVKGDH
jgi:hypothetical protein